MFFRPVFLSFSVLLWIALWGVPVSGQPAINLSAGALPDFRAVYPGHFSDVQFYQVTGENLEGELEIHADHPFRVSLDCYDGFDSELTLAAEGGEVSARIFVRLFPENTGVFEGAISHTSDGSQSVGLIVSGEGIDTTIPEGYYDGATGAGSVLKSQLHEIIRGHSVQSYGSLWDHFTVTDATFDGYVWDMYSDIPCDDPPYIYTFYEDQDTGTGGTEEGDVYNREHSMPRSWFGGAVNPMNTDLFHIFPVDKYVNAVRDNYPFGAVDSPQQTFMNGATLGPNVAGGYAGLAYEPIDEYKGDLARAFLYMVTRYENKLPGWENMSEYGDAMFDYTSYTGFQPWVIDMFIEWHENDPVSQKEILRNHAVYEIQGNRNPFVDHPQWVNLIWGDTTAVATPAAPATGSYNVYPNPSGDRLWVETSYEMLQLRLYSVSGRLLKDIGLSGTRFSICLQHLVPGVYFLHVRTKTGVVRERVVKR